MVVSREPSFLLRVPNTRCPGLVVEDKVSGVRDLVGISHRDETCACWTMFWALPVIRETTPKRWSVEIAILVCSWTSEGVNSAVEMKKSRCHREQRARHPYLLRRSLSRILDANERDGVERAEDSTVSNRRTLRALERVTRR